MTETNPFARIADTVEWWWPNDARNHSERGRCGNCGHSRRMHEHDPHRGAHAGPCKARSIGDDRCKCRHGEPPRGAS